MLIVNSLTSLHTSESVLLMNFFDRKQAFQSSILHITQCSFCQITNHFFVLLFVIICGESVM